jgi:Arc/MetJ family transcription regulator
MWARTNLDFDEAAGAVVMRRYGLHTKCETVNFVLPELVGQLSTEDARR